MTRVKSRAQWQFISNTNASKWTQPVASRLVCQTKCAECVRQLQYLVSERTCRLRSNFTERFTDHHFRDAAILLNSRLLLRLFVGTTGTSTAKRVIFIRQGKSQPADPRFSCRIAPEMWVKLAWLLQHHTVWIFCINVASNDRTVEWNEIAVLEWDSYLTIFCWYGYVFH